jgi:hypothetical protein
MRSEQFTSASTRESDAPSWLKEQVYAPKKQRTLDLVQRSIQCLHKERKPISLASIAAISKTIDPIGQGVSESAVLNNEEARALYEQHRTWKGSPRRGTSITKKVKATRISTKTDRDQEQVLQRYLRLSKAELVDRLLAVEAAYAEQEHSFLSQQDEALTWRLRAEQAEDAISKATGSRREKKGLEMLSGNRGP